jgi:hypothetical protein
MNDTVCSRAARAIKQSQFSIFEAKRLSSQPGGAIQTNELTLAGSLGVMNTDAASTSLTQDLKVKEGDGDEGVKSVTIDGEVLVIESKQKIVGAGMRSKRTTIPTVGIPIIFADAFSIIVPSRIADVRLSFSDSLQRDLFAYRLFLHSKGQLNFDSNMESLRKLSVTSEASSVNSVQSDATSPRFFPEWLFCSFVVVLLVCKRHLMLYYSISSQDAASKKSLYKQGYLNKQVW